TNPGDKYVHYGRTDAGGKYVYRGVDTKFHTNPGLKYVYLVLSVTVAAEIDAVGRPWGRRG
ncbi:MAG: hypothetical protein WCB61_19050, partial [Pseudolabrys sp.]